MAEASSYIRWFETLTAEDVGKVGGKNATLGEMVRTRQEEGGCVSDGFATTAEACWTFLAENDLQEEMRSQREALERDEQSLAETGEATRALDVSRQVAEVEAPHTATTS